MIKIMNLRMQKPEKDCDVRVDRSTVLGNPFYMNEESERDKVCDKYETYFAKQLHEDSDFLKEVERIVALYQIYGELNLFCWCSPKRCHAETIRQYVLQRCQ